MSAPTISPPPAQSIGIVVGVFGAIVGLFPWLAGGGGLPLQNLWDGSAPPDPAPFVLLPFSQYYLVEIAALLGVGWCATALAARLTRRRWSGGGLAWMMVGVALVQACAIAQTVLVVVDGLRAGVEAAIYVTFIAVICVVMMLIGAGCFATIVLAERAGALPGMTMGAVAVSVWLPMLTHTMGADLDIGRWVAPVLAGVAIGWCGARSVGRVVAVLSSFLIVWGSAAMITAVRSAFGSRVLLRSPVDLVDQFLTVLRSAAVMPSAALPPLLVAAVVGCIAAIGFRIARPAAQKHK